MEFREMRRSRQQLPQREAEEILEQATAGVLAVAGDGGYPYAVPVSYVFRDGTIFIHSAPAGHKFDAIRRDGRVSFCVIAQDEVIPAHYTTHYRSVIVFGRARILEDEAERRAALAAIAAKYSPDDPAGREAETDRQLPRTALIALTPERLTGKEAIELTRARGEREKK